MASHKTKNLGLNSWERTDAFSMDEFNENFDKIDQAVAENQAARATIPKITFGTYKGNYSAIRKIELPFTPKIVYQGDEQGRTSDNYSGAFGGVALKGHPAMHGSNTMVEIVEGGFNVFYHGRNDVSNNNAGTTYCYFAIG